MASNNVNNATHYITIYNTSSWSPAIYYKNGTQFEPFPLISTNVNTSHNPAYDIITIHRVNFEPSNLIMFVDDMSNHFVNNYINKSEDLKTGFSISGECQFSLEDGDHFLIYNNGDKLLSIRQGKNVQFDNNGHISVDTIIRNNSVNLSKVQSWTPNLDAKRSDRKLYVNTVTIINSSNWNPQVFDIDFVSKHDSYNLDHYIDQTFINDQHTDNDKNVCVYRDVTPYFPGQFNHTKPFEFIIKTHDSELIAHRYIINDFKGLKIKFSDYIPPTNKERYHSEDSLLLPPHEMPISTLIENGMAEFSLQNGRIFYIYNVEPKLLKITQYNSEYDVANRISEKSNLTQGWVPDINATLSLFAIDNLCNKANIVTLYNTSSWAVDISYPSITNSQKYNCVDIIKIGFGPTQTLIPSFKIKFSDCLTFNKHKLIANSCEFLLSNGINFNIYDLGDHICVEQIESGIISCWVPDMFANKFA
jgi:hypothetical protein